MMDALVKAAPEKGLVLTQVPKPVPGMGEVLIKIHKTAICGTDVHIYNWNQWAQETIKPPMVIGHEYVGEIAELGPGVTAYHVGQMKGILSAAPAATAVPATVSTAATQRAWA